MKRLVIVVGIAGLTASLFAQAQTPPAGGGGAPEPEGERLRAKLAGEFTPRVSDEIGNGPVPRLHDGRPDPLGSLGRGRIQLGPR